MEAIILAGGLGTRLKSAVKALPKSMAQINGRPFLEYLLDQLLAQGVKRVVLSVGYKAESIQEHFRNEYKGCELVYAVEQTQLGTGGAIKNALPYIQSKDVIIVNGDSIFLTNLQTQLKAHREAGAQVTLALNPMRNIERYGTVDLDPKHRIVRFNEKQPLEEGWINTGTYIFNVAAFQALDFPEKFSIEKEFFETHLEQLHFLGFHSKGYFLDIGIPKDFKKAQYELGVFPQIDRSWTLFLDRDGVINKKRDNDYVKNLDELELLSGAVEAIADFSALFGRIIVVTNQQGIGKGLMTAAALTEVHDHLAKQVKQAGGHIDAIYHAPQLAAENSVMRKPQIGMAHQAKNAFQEIDFSKSIMVGDSPSDIEFGKNAGMYTLFVGADVEQVYPYAVDSLARLGELLNSIFLSRKRLQN